MDKRPWQPRVDTPPLFNPFEPSTEWTEQLGDGSRVEIENEEEAVEDKVLTDPPAKESATSDPQRNPSVFRELPTQQESRTMATDIFAQSTPDIGARRRMDGPPRGAASSSGERISSATSMPFDARPYLRSHTLGWRVPMIRRAAYLRSLSRGFQPGKELEDWLAAEQEVENLIARGAAPYC